MPRELTKTFLSAVLLALLFANIMLYRSLMPLSPRVSVFAAGKGRAALVQTNERTILIDAGSDAGILRALGETLPPWHRRLDAIILTSPAASALSEVASRYRVPNVIRFGTREVPYGARLILNNVSIEIAGPGANRIRSGSSVFEISSTTETGSRAVWPLGGVK